MLELRHFRYCIALAEELHFSRAAERLGITQPSLSHQIKAMETMLGAQLFIRTKHRVTLSDAGLLFLAEARLAVRQFDRAELVGKRSGRGELGQIEIGYVGSAAYNGVLPAAISAYRKSHPTVDMRLRELDMETQLVELEEGRLDVAFIRPPVIKLPLGVQIRVVVREPIVLALPTDHPLAASKEIAVGALADERFISTHLNVGMGFFHHMMSLCHSGGFSPNITQQAQQFSTIVSLVGAGLGVALVPSCLSCVNVPNVTYRPLSDETAFCELAVVYRRGERAPAVKAFIRKVHAVFI